MSLQVGPPSPAGWPRLAHRTERASPRAQALLKSLIMLHLPLSHQPKQISVQTQTQSGTSPTSSWEEMQRIFIHFWQFTADIKNERVASFFYDNGYRVMQNVYFLQTMSNYIFFFFVSCYSFCQSMYGLSFGRNRRSLVVCHIVRMLVTVYSAPENCLRLCRLCAAQSRRCYSHNILGDFRFL